MWVVGSRSATSRAGHPSPSPATTARARDRGRRGGWPGPRPRFLRRRLVPRLVRCRSGPICDLVAPPRMVRIAAGAGQVGIRTYGRPPSSPFA